MRDILGRASSQDPQPLACWPLPPASPQPRPQPRAWPRARRHRLAKSARSSPPLLHVQEVQTQLSDHWGPKNLPGVLSACQPFSPLVGDEPQPILQTPSWLPFPLPSLTLSLWPTESSIFFQSENTVSLFFHFKVRSLLFLFVPFELSRLSGTT